MGEALVKLYLFKELSETAKQKALEMLKESFIEVGKTTFNTEELRENIENVLFYRDGTVA